MLTSLCNFRVFVITSTFNIGTNIVPKETVAYIDQIYGSRYQSEFSFTGLVYFAPHDNVPPVILSTITSIEYLIAYNIDVKCTAYKPPALGSSMFIAP